MTDVILLTVWQLVGIVAGTAAVTSVLVGTPAAYFAARRGATNAIRTCSAHHDCAMMQSRKRDADTADLEKQLVALHAERPEIAAVRVAMKQAAEDSGAVSVARTRAQKDVDRDGDT